MKRISVQVQRLDPAIPPPRYAHEGDAGVDLHSAADITVAPGERALVPTGLRMAIPSGYEGQVRPKSGLALKHGITVLNTPGTVDAPYRGEVGVIVINHDPREPYAIKKGEKIAQMVFAKVERASFREAGGLDATTRGAGGYGSTGKR
ncbi:MAG: dUTP diphosphatase [Elusimicrobia bacterium]|nr:dUTP diphosphatase [Elusimicrobiota bacterium]